MLHHAGFRHQHLQVRMGSHADGVAAFASAAGSAVLLGMVAQPGLHQSQAQVILAEAGRPLQQPGMAALLQECHGLLPQPGSQRTVALHLCFGGRTACTAHASQPF